MPFIPTADEWLALSAQLLESRPSTTRVTTKYNITPSKARKARRPKQGSAAADDDADTPMQDAKPPRAKLILKTFCPQSGVCLKYKTCKAAEVGRLVQMLGSLGRGMSGMAARALPAAATAEEEGPAAAAGTPTPTVVAAAAAGAPASSGVVVVGGKGKKKKKGKR